MAVRSIAAGEALPTAVGDVAVWILSGGSPAKLNACLRELVPHTPVQVPLVVTDPAVSEQDLDTQFASERQILLAPGGDPAVAAGRADLVLLELDCRVADGWLEGLAQAAYCDSIIASARPLTASELGLVDLVDRDRVARAAADVRCRSLRLRPRVPYTPVGCVYVRRTALDLVGGFGDSFFAQAERSGLAHVLADDVLTVSARRHAPEALSSDAHARGLSIARRAVKPLSLVIDARLGTGQMTGTYRHVTELIATLARTGRPSIRVVVDSDTDAALGRFPDVELISEAQAMATPGDVVHRPLQVFRDWDLTTLTRMGERTVLSNHDLIGYRNPSYSPSDEEWVKLRQLTQRALALADAVVFGSTHALDDAVADDLIDRERAAVIPSGVDHVRRSPVVKPSRATGLPDDVPMILCLGADYRHKNRVFALRVLERLQRSYLWDGYLAFAGPKMEHGSSAVDEARMLANDSHLSAHTLDLGAVGESEKEWLLQRSALVFYPTVYEGFGLVPFEAAERSVPCMWTNTASLRELLGGQEAPIVSWDAGATAVRALELLRNGAKAQQNVARIKSAATRLTWDAAAEALLELYDRVCSRPSSAAARFSRGTPEAAISDDALRLVGSAGVLPRELERPILALATHPRLGRPILGGIRLGYRVAWRARRLSTGARDSRQPAVPPG